MNSKTYKIVVLFLIILNAFMIFHIGKSQAEQDNLSFTVDRQQKELIQKDFIISAISNKNILLAKKDTIYLQEIKSIQNNYKKIYEKIDNAPYDSLDFIIDGLLQRYRLYEKKRAN
jgi:hypothetical protein